MLGVRSLSAQHNVAEVRGCNPTKVTQLPRYGICRSLESSSVYGLDVSRGPTRKCCDENKTKIANTLQTCISPKTSTSVQMKN